MPEIVSDVSVFEFLALPSAWSEPQADNRLTARVEARSIGINFFFINPPEMRIVSCLKYAGVKNR